MGSPLKISYIKQRETGNKFYKSLTHIVNLLAMRLYVHRWGKWTGRCTHTLVCYYRAMVLKGEVLPPIRDSLELCQSIF